MYTTTTINDRISIDAAIANGRGLLLSLTLTCLFVAVATLPMLELHSGLLVDSRKLPGKTREMVIGVTERDVDHRQAFEVMPGDVFVCHADSAM